MPNPPYAPAPETEEQYEANQTEAKREALPLPLRPRLRFNVSEITKTSRGVSLVTLAAAHDPTVAHTGGIGAPVSQRPLAAPNPKGSISLEVSPEYGAGLALGDTFYLVSA